MPSRQATVINRDWRFLRQDVPSGQMPAMDDSSWQRIGLPHTFDLPYFRTPEFYVGFGWYRRHFVIPMDALNRRWFVEFEGVFQVAEVFVNGVRVGRHQGGYTGFSVDITDAVVPGDNLLAVRVNNLWNPQLAPRAGEHIFSGGIYRDVHLTSKAPLHVSWHGSSWNTPVVTHESALVEAITEIYNAKADPEPLTVEASIIDSDGRIISRVETPITVPAGSMLTIRQSLPEIRRPKLWHPDHPHLYQLQTRLIHQDNAIDSTVIPIGLRWFNWTADRGFFLNGEHLYLRGANLHQDISGWGIGVTQGAIRRDVQLMKDAGFNFIRGAHYPHHPAFSRACDELGMLLWCELPFWGKGGFGPEGYWNASAYPSETRDFAGFEENCKATLEEMIRIHRNHPSIVAWSMTNEAFFTYNIESARALVRTLVAQTHKEDPSRPAAVGGAQRGDFDQLGDLAGYNGDGAKLFLNPGVPNMVSEYGAISKPPDAYDPFFGDLQPDVFPWRAGQAIWCGADYGTIAGRQGLKGIVDHARLPKRSWHWYRNAYRKISPPVWPGTNAPAMLTLEASNLVICGTAAIEDAQIIVTVCDASGQRVDATPLITLRIESGPGEFPTGRTITFDPSTDITFFHGQAAIAFRSYHGGETLIRASCPGLQDASIRITTEGKPDYFTVDQAHAVDRPYIPPQESEAARLAMKNAVNVARDRPSRASSEDAAHPARLANDADDDSFWRAATDDLNPFWQVDLEGYYQLSSLRIVFPEAGNYRFILATSIDSTTWQDSIDRSASVNAAKNRNDVFPFAIQARYVRITCVQNPSSNPFGLCEVELFGVLAVR